MPVTQLSIGLEYPCKIQYRLRDLKGYTNSSLKELARSLSLKMGVKDELDDYKTKMDVALKGNTSLFIKYAMDDCLIMHEIFLKEMTYP